MKKDDQERADALFEEALGNRGARDPREYYRQRLRDLKKQDAQAYDRAVQYYTEQLIPSIASGEAEPLSAWQAYGLEIARLTADGRTVEVDPSGRAGPYEAPGTPENMVLHIPGGRGSGRAILVGLPVDPSPAQLATYDLLVAGKHKLRD